MEFMIGNTMQPPRAIFFLLLFIYNITCLYVNYIKYKIYKYLYMKILFKNNKLIHTNIAWNKWCENKFF